MQWKTVPERRKREVKVKCECKREEEDREGSKRGGDQRSRKNERQTQ